MRYGIGFFAVCLVLACGGTGKDAGGIPATFPIKLGTFTQLRQHGVTDLFVHSPWEPEQYSQLTFPEHCWGLNLPNTSHDSDTAVASRWVISPDSSRAVFENRPREGVVYRSLAQVDSMAVRLKIEIENHSELPVNNIRALVCFKPDNTVGNPGRPDCMLAFRDTTHELVWFRSGGRNIQLHEQTTYHGDYPPNVDETNLRNKIVWGVNIEGYPDVRSIEDVGWWFMDNHPGRVVEERADPALIAIHARGDTTRWIGLIWDPPRNLMANPVNPCFHSDPSFPDCPPGGTTGAQGILLFHDGTFDRLVERALAWKAALPR
ncbi:MAG TPA: hypothetical protein VM123_14430 [archaeon]|nr:hypothetical protein [archaeon]